MLHPFAGLLNPKKEGEQNTQESPNLTRRSALKSLGTGIAGAFAIAATVAKAQYDDSNGIPPDAITEALNEDGRATSFALGEEGGGKATTKRLDEEGGNMCLPIPESKFPVPDYYKWVTTRTLNEEGGLSLTEVKGEEGLYICGGIMSTMAMGEEGGDMSPVTTLSCAETGCDEETDTPE